MRFQAAFRGGFFIDGRYRRFSFEGYSVLVLYQK